MLPGVDRPALAVTIPTRRHPAILLDVGASVECRPQHLLQFAVMGSVYARVSLGLSSPRVGLLSIGEEATKGNELTREAHRLLKASSLGFIGNVEARDVYSGQADVIVCDGFTGNVALKISEGLVDTVEALLREELSSTFAMRVGSLLTRRALRHFRRRLDYSEYGGAPLLGVAGLAIVGHGRSSALAVRNAVAMAYRFASDRFIERVEREIAGTTVSHP
jgi:glycerol-3-phosphate acyltransferase PlsX